MTYINIIKEIIEENLQLELSDKNRSLPYVEARAIFYKICQDYLKNSFRYDAVGEAVNRTHATVIHGIKLFEILCHQDKHFKSKYVDLEIIVSNKIIAEEEHTRIKKLKFKIIEIQEMNRKNTNKLSYFRNENKRLRNQLKQKT